MTDEVVYGADPLARLLVGRLRLTPRTMALAVLGWSLFYLLLLPAVFGSLHSREGYLGSLGDWHAQLLLLLVFPVTCAFYVWQPQAIAGVYRALGSREGGVEAGKAFRSRVWLCLSTLLGVAIVIFDSPKMVASQGSLWMAENWLAILGREASLAFAFYVIGMMFWRQSVAIWEWRRLPARASSVSGLKAVSNYGLSWAFLLALLGLRLSVEAIELPRRVGAITPDYYVKIAAYVVISVLFFFAPIWGAQRRDSGLSRDQLLVWLRLAGIVALPLLGFVVLKLVVGQ